MRIIEPVFAQEHQFDRFRSSLRSLTVYRSSRLFWHRHLIEGLEGEVKIYEVTPGQRLRVIRELQRIDPYRATDQAIVQYCEWLPHSGIHWHPDDRYAWSATLYLDTVVEGGEFQWIDAESVLNSYRPRANSMILSFSQLHHRVCTVISQPRRTIQIWSNP